MATKLVRHFRKFCFEAICLHMWRKSYVIGNN